MLFSEIMPTVLSIPNDTVIQFISFFITVTIFVSIPFVIVLLFTSYRTKTPVINIIADKFGASPIENHIDLHLYYSRCLQYFQHY